MGKRLRFFFTMFSTSDVERIFYLCILAFRIKKNPYRGSEHKFALYLSNFITKLSAFMVFCGPWLRLWLRLWNVWQVVLLFATHTSWLNTQHSRSTVCTKLTYNKYFSLKLFDVQIFLCILGESFARWHEESLQPIRVSFHVGRLPTRF